MLEEERGYGWVRPPAPVELRPLDPNGHGLIRRDAFTGRLRLCLTALTPLHVGAGEYVPDSSGRPVQALARTGGQPVIPGSTIKGMVRSLAEAVSHSCNPLERGSRCPQKDREKGEFRACPACQLFGFIGARSLRGRVRFSDFVLDGPAAGQVEILGLPQPFPAVARSPDLRKVYRHALEPRSGPLPVETVRAGARFSGDIWMENLSQDELAHLAFALGLDGSFQHKVGFGKSAGYGSAALSLVEATYRFAPGGAPDLAGLAGSYGAAGGKIGPAVQQVREILRWPRPLPALAGGEG